MYSYLDIFKSCLDTQSLFRGILNRGKNRIQRPLECLTCKFVTTGVDTSSWSWVAQITCIFIMALHVCQCILVHLNGFYQIYCSLDACEGFKHVHNTAQLCFPGTDEVDYHFSSWYQTHFSLHNFPVAGSSQLMRSAEYSLSMVCFMNFTLFP